MSHGSHRGGRAPSRRNSRLATIGALVLGPLVSAGFIWHASYSAFTVTTANPTNNWSTGTVALSDDDTNTAMFTVANMKPGSTGSKCIAVTSTGSLASSVKLYGTGYATTNALASTLDLTVVQGTGGSFGSCTGFAPLGSNSAVYTGTVAGFSSAASSFANGVGVWAPTGTASETRVYQFTYTLETTTPTSTQGGTASLGFTWEAQNS